MKECESCKKINDWSKHLSESPDKMTTREYWLLTEIFVLMHNGKDYCSCKTTKTVKEPIKNYQKDIKCLHCGSSNVYVSCLDCKKEG